MQKETIAVVAATAVESLLVSALIYHQDHGTNFMSYMTNGVRDHSDMPHRERKSYGYLVIARQRLHQIAGIFSRLEILPMYISFPVIFTAKE